MVPLVIITLLLGYEYIYGAAVWDQYYCSNTASYSDAGTQIVRELEDKGCDVPKDIYVVDSYDRIGVQRNTYAYQLILNEYTIYAKQPEDLTKDNIVFSTISNYQELSDAGYKKAQLDNNEYVYVKGGQVHGIRKGDWVYLPKTGNSKFKEGDVPELFNLKQDVGESDNLLQKYPDKVKELQLLMQKY